MESIMKKVIIALLVATTLLTSSNMVVKAEEQREWPESWGWGCDSEGNEGIYDWEKREFVTDISEEDKMAFLIYDCGEEYYKEYLESFSPYYEYDSELESDDYFYTEVYKHKGDDIWNNGPNAKFGYHKDKKNVKNNFRVVQIAKDNVKVYMKKSTKSGEWGILSKNDYILVCTPNKDCKISGNWLKIRIDEDTFGYIKNVKGVWKNPSKTEGAQPKKLLASCKTVLYDKPNGKKICTIKQGSEMTLLDYTRYHYYKVKYNGKIGYIKDGHVISAEYEADLISGEYKKVICENSVPMYEKYERDAKVICQLNKGSKVTLLSKIDNAWKVKYGKKTGYVLDCYLSEYDSNGCYSKAILDEDDIIGAQITKYQHYNAYDSLYHGYNNFFTFMSDTIYIAPSGYQYIVWSSSYCN